jgi:hypothetical protein
MKSNTKNKILLPLAGTAIAVTAYCFGAGLIPTNFNFAPENKVQANTEIQAPTVEARLIETHTVEYVEETIIEKEYVDVIRQVSMDMRNFDTKDELEKWIDTGFMTTIRFEQDDNVIDCDDYAIEMQQRALADGYIISFEIINAAEYNELFSTQLPTGQALHAINLAIIGNDVYYIEPQTGETVHAACLD